MLGSAPVLAVECLRPGERPATAQDQIVIDGVLPVGTCFPPNDANIGNSEQQAKNYLQTIFTNGGQQCTPPEEKLGKVNGIFATCAAQFLQAYQSKYGRVTINRAYNTTVCEARLCVNNPGCGGFNNVAAPNTSHTKGVAMDVSAANQEQLIGFAHANPQFGVCFPLASWDKVHLVLAGVAGNGESAGCARMGITKPCNGLTIDPNSLNPPSYVATTPPPPNTNTSPQYPGNTTPTIQPVQPTPQLTQPTTLATTPEAGNTIAYPAGTCAPQFFCFNNNVEYRASTCIDMQYQTCPKGCTAGSCIYSSPTATTSTSTLSAFNLIDIFASGPTSIQTPTTTTLALNSNMVNMVELYSAAPSSATPQVPSGETYALTSAPQTFVSEDMKNNSNTSTLTPVLTTGFQSTLIDLKSALLTLLNFLKPFGGHTAAQSNPFPPSAQLQY